MLNGETEEFDWENDDALEELRKSIIGCNRSFAGKMSGNIRVELRGRVEVPRGGR